MDAYTGFAQVYDLFMDNVPYEHWCAHICAVLAAHRITDGTLLELGCGTGRMTRLLAERGYDMIGVDNSVEMLAIAAGADDSQEILYLQQDMQELELNQKVRAVFSACDCINYVPGEDGLRSVFERVRRCLLPRGLFLFDMNTPYKYSELLGDNTFAENREEGSFIWENYFDEDEGINEYDLTLFLPDGKGLYRKLEEVHYQRCYEVELVERLLVQSGFALLGVYDAYSDEPLRTDSERALFVAERDG